MVPDVWGWICVSEGDALADVVGDVRPLTVVAEEIVGHNWQRRTAGGEDSSLVSKLEAGR